MTIRWQTGKKPTEAEIRSVITNAISKFIDTDDVAKIAHAIRRFYEDRVEGRK